jgi:hypothetical protein
MLHVSPSSVQDLRKLNKISVIIAHVCKSDEEDNGGGMNSKGMEFRDEATSSLSAISIVYSVYSFEYLRSK